MAYCRKCGKSIYDEAVICPYCGVSQNNQYYEDSGNFGWAVLSFFIPLVGFILFLAWNKSRPKNSKLCLKGFLTAIISIGTICIAISLIAVINVVNINNKFKAKSETIQTLDYNMVYMPDLVGLTVDEATSVLEKNDLTAQAIYEEDSVYDKDYVISQDIPTGVAIERGSKVYLKISSGK